MIPIFNIFQDQKGEWRFRLRARNGKIIASSEGYTSRRGCENGIRSVQECAPDAVIIYTKK